MFANAPEQVFKDLGSLPITANLHHDGVPPSVFTTNPKLVDFYGTPISTNAGRDGKVRSSHCCPNNAVACH